MKKILFLVLLSVIFIQVLTAQTVNEQIAEIDRIKVDIKNNLGNYTKIEVFKDSTGYRYVYKQDNTLKLISIAYKDRRNAGKYIYKEVEWYFCNGYLVATEQNWSDFYTKQLMDRQLFYLNDTCAIAWIDFENKKVDTDSEEFKREAAILLKYGQDLFKKNK